MSDLNKNLKGLYKIEDWIYYDLNVLKTEVNEKSMLVFTALQFC